VAELPHHVVKQTPLNRIVIDKENTRRHGQYPARKLCRFEALCAGWLKGSLGIAVRKALSRAAAKAKISRLPSAQSSLCFEMKSSQSS
jgi:hypothetical protein